jgi:hypothetical protein
MKQRVFKLPKSKKITVSDLLGQNEINSLLNDVIKDKANVDGILVITQDHDGKIAWKVAGLNGLEVIGLLEQVKAWECEDVCDD